MKKDLIFTIKIFLCLILICGKACADDFIMPDWSYYTYRENAKVTENADEIKYEKIRKEHDFDEFFDRQTIIIHKHTNLTPQEAGRQYLARTMFCSSRAEKYVLRDDVNDFLAIYCSHNRKICEIIRFYNGFDGLIEVRYTHNNLWHFQNNIGSFLSTQMRIKHKPYEFIMNELAHKKEIIRL